MDPSGNGALEVLPLSLTSVACPLVLLHSNDVPAQKRASSHSPLHTLLVPFRVRSNRCTLLMLEYTSMLPSAER